MKRLCSRCFFEEYSPDYTTFLEMSAIDVICEKCGEKTKIVVNYSMGIPLKNQSYLYLGPSETKEQ